MIGSMGAAFFFGAGTTITVPHWHLAFVPAISSDTVCRVLQLGHLNAEGISGSLRRQLRTACGGGYCTGFSGERGLSLGN
jgi:hypothetical protein